MAFNRDINDLLEGVLEIMERAAFPVGTVRTWKRGEYVKTEKGWRRSGAGASSSAATSSGGGSSSGSSIAKAVAAYIQRKAKEMGSDWNVEDGLARYGEESGLNRAQTSLENDYAMGKNWDAMNKQSDEIESSLKDILGDNPKVSGFISNVKGTFSQKYSGWQTLSDTERRLKDLSDAASNLPNDKETLKKAGVSSEQAEKVSELLKSQVARAQQRIDAARAAAKKAAPIVVAATKKDMAARGRTVKAEM